MVVPYARRARHTHSSVPDMSTTASIFHRYTHGRSGKTKHTDKIDTPRRVSCFLVCVQKTQQQQRPFLRCPACATHATGCKGVPLAGIPRSHSSLETTTRAKLSMRARGGGSRKQPSGDHHDEATYVGTHNSALYQAHTHTNPARTGRTRSMGGRADLLQQQTLTDLARSFALSTSRGFIFQLPAMKGTRAIIWHEAADEPRGAVVATPAPWKAVVGATKADPAPKPASVNREVSFIVERRRGRERGGRGRGKRERQMVCRSHKQRGSPAHTRERERSRGDVDIAEPLLASLLLMSVCAAVCLLRLECVSCWSLLLQLLVGGRRESETERHSEFGRTTDLHRVQGPKGRR